MAHASDVPRGEVVVYQSADGEVRVEVHLEQETVWLTVEQMAALFDRHRTVILRHLRNVFAFKELDRTSTCAKNAQVQLEGGHEVLRAVEFFNLDAILSVGYRVNSKRGTQFRIWATRTLPSAPCATGSAPAARRAGYSDANATARSPASSAPSSRPSTASRSTAPPRSAPRTCSTSR